jgi:NADP-dependent alcohol dehydrogenase
MLNFTYQNPTKILFGKGQIANIAAEIPADARVLLTYGGGSIHRNGVYEQTRQALAGRTVVEFGGIEPNPEYRTLLRAVELGRAEKVDLLLAVGGGSVADGTKFIGAAIPFAGEPWEILEQHAPVTAAVPLAVILTLPATGSESNSFAVISRAERGQKLAFSSSFGYPRFAVLDPETTFSLPPRQVANGVVDAFVHTLEQYLTYPVNAPLQDRFAESILQTLIEVGPRTLAAPADYDLRASFVWCATMALNGLIGVGVPQDWATHMIGHELTALYGIDHARTLAAVIPHLLRVQGGPKADKLAQYATRVWGIGEGSREQRIEAGIQATERFFESLGVPTRLKAYAQVQPGTPAAVARRLEKNGMARLGERQDVTPERVERILELSLAG